MDTVFNLFINGLQNILNLYTLSIGIAGAVMGVIVGALPGLGPSAGIALLLPITLKMNSDVALLMVISLYVGASFGGRISSILTNIPGDAASVATTFDGYPMTLKGQAGVALSLSAVASFIGGLIGVVIAVSFGNSISKYALMFGPPEYFAVMLLALGAISLLAGKNRVKTIVMTMLGLLLSMVGLDYVSGQNRLTFGSVHLEMGLDFLVMVMGVFAIGEILMQIYKGTKIEFKQEKFKINELLPEKKVWKRVSIPILRSSLLGFIVGVLPGAGATSATFLAYAVAKKMSRHPEEFGKGAPEGVSSVECANNSAAVGALIPMLTLGVPGSGTTAIILGALIMWGVRPGPLLIIECPQMYWGLFAALFLINIILLVMNIAFIPGFIWIVKSASKYLYTIIGCISIIGVYSINNQMSDLIIMLVIGIVGYYFKRASYPIGPLILSMVLGPMVESSFRQSLMLSNGNFSIFFNRPISAVILGATFSLWALVIMIPILKDIKEKNLIHKIL